MIAFLAGLPLVSRPIIAEWFRQNPKTETKSDSSPVTIADRSVETALRAAITQRFPEDTISGEEFGPDDRSDPIKGVTSSYRWIIDPIDGTTNFVHGIAQFAISIAAEENGEITAGLISTQSARSCFGQKKAGELISMTAAFGSHPGQRYRNPFSRRAFHSWAEALRKNMINFCRR